MAVCRRCQSVCDTLRMVVQCCGRLGVCATDRAGPIPYRRCSQLFSAPTLPACPHGVSEQLAAQHEVGSTGVGALVVVAQRADEQVVLAVAIHVTVTREVVAHHVP